jgi:AcrR family transcriptional regulator
MPEAPVPQQARARATRKKVVDAAVTLLGEEGLAGVRTAAVARRAGVSQGALFRHFPTKAALLGAALESTLDALYTRFGEGMLARAGSGEDLLRSGVDALWEVYTDPTLYGGFELFLAARTDPALRAVTGPILRAHLDRELALARLLWPDAAASHPRFDATVVGLLATLQGLAVGAAAWPLPEDTDRPERPVELDFIEELARRELGEPDLDPFGGAP